MFVRVSVPVRVPVPSICKKSLSWKTMVEEERLKVKSPKPTIVQSGVNGAEGAKIQDWGKETACPVGILINEPSPASTLGKTHDLIPAAAAIFGVMLPAES